MKTRFLALAFPCSFALLVIACTSSSSSSSSSSSGGTSSSSGDPDGGGDAGVCTEIHLGAKNDPLGGGRTSEVTAQATSDLHGATGKQVEALTTACKAFAVALDAAPADQTAADGEADPLDKLDAWCDVVVKQVQVLKTQAGAVLSVTYEPPTPVCKLSIQQKADCQAACNGSACDVAANPMTCTGGALADGFCTGGTLGGGCKAEARCDASCDVSVIAFAECPKPTVTSKTNNTTGDPAAATKLREAVDANLPAVLALRTQCELESNVGPSFVGSVSTVQDIKPACIPPLVKATRDADEYLKSCFVSASAVVGSAQ